MFNFASLFLKYDQHAKNNVVEKNLLLSFKIICGIFKLEIGKLKLSLNHDLKSQVNLTYYNGPDVKQFHCKANTG